MDKRKKPVKPVLNEKGDIIVVFIAGKYFSDDFNIIDENIRVAEQYAIKLWNLGFGVFTPHLNTHHFEVKAHVSEEVYRKFDLRVLEFVNCIFVLPNWRESNGAKEEVREAIKLGKPVFEDFKSLINWTKSKGEYITIFLNNPKEA